MSPRISTLKDLWPHVTRGRGCWLIKGMEWSHYPGIVLNGVRMRGNRAVWTALHGPIPPDVYVCHRCDFPGCVRPSHLFAASKVGNGIDIRLKGRAFNGKGRRRVPSFYDFCPPPKPPRLNHRNIRFSKSDMRDIRKVARTHGLSVSEWVRAVAAAAARRAILDAEEIRLRALEAA